MIVVKSWILYFRIVASLACQTIRLTDVRLNSMICQHTDVKSYSVHRAGITVIGRRIVRSGCSVIPVVSWLFGSRVVTVDIGQWFSVVYSAPLCTDSTAKQHVIWFMALSYCFHTSIELANVTPKQFLLLSFKRFDKIRLFLAQIGNIFIATHSMSWLSSAINIKRKHRIWPTCK